MDWNFCSLLMMVVDYDYSSTDFNCRIAYGPIQLRKVWKQLYYRSWTAWFIGDMILVLWLLYYHFKFVALLYFTRWNRSNSFTFYKTVFRHMFILFTTFEFETFQKRPIFNTVILCFLQNLSVLFLLRFSLSLYCLSCCNCLITSDTVLTRNYMHTK